MRRLRSPTTALVLGAIVGALAVGAVATEAGAHQLTLGGYLSELPNITAFTAVGAVVAYRRAENRMGWMLLGIGAFWVLSDLGGSYSALDYRIHHGSLPLGPIAVLVGPSWSPMLVLLVLVIVLYPSGRLPSPRWSWPVRALGVLATAWVLGAYAIAAASVLGGPIDVTSGGDLRMIDQPVGHWAWWATVQTIWFVAIVFVFAAWLVRQVIGYRRLSDEHRAQQKWIAVGATFCVVGGMASIWLASVPAIANPAAVLVAGLPVAMGVGIMRYRLYEIDRIISRTLSYAIVTALLVGTFVGFVLLSTRVLPFSSTVGVAASTLGAAALFNPLRVRVQRRVDRRFNRFRYDAEATVAAFAERLRDTVDLDAVQQDLVEIVRAAMQPQHVTVWLRDSGPQSPTGA